MVKYANKHLSKKKKEAKKANNIAKREFNQKDVKVLKELGQKLFNQFIRLRDKDLSCISCGTTKDIQYHAGHYKPQGGFGYLRFNELNVHKQCSVCNNHRSGNLVPYRIALIKKISLEAVEKLEQPNQIKKWTTEELQEVITTYKQKIKEFNNS